MSGKKLVVVAHGIGDTPPDFYKAWADVLHANHGTDRFDVVGLYWEDVLDKVAERYPLISDRFADVVAQCGFNNLKNLVDSNTYKTVYDSVMDVLVYAGLDEMARYIQNQCIMKLHNLAPTPQQKARTILVGHSLGAAMLPHIVWREWSETQTIPYPGLLLMASPLGFKAPSFSPMHDLLYHLSIIAGGDRLGTLRLFGNAWSAKGPGSLRFFINEYDIVCSDVLYDIGTGHPVDLIPVQQGFNAVDKQTLSAANPGCLHTFRFGTPTPGNIVSNHAALTYLARPEFGTAFEDLLNRP